MKVYKRIKNLLPQGLRTPRSRRAESTVPAKRTSSSGEGRISGSWVSSDDPSAIPNDTASPSVISEDAVIIISSDDENSVASVKKDVTELTLFEEWKAADTVVSCSPSVDCEVDDPDCDADSNDTVKLGKKKTPLGDDEEVELLDDAEYWRFMFGKSEAENKELRLRIEALEHDSRQCGRIEDRCSSSNGFGIGELNITDGRIEASSNGKDADIGDTSTAASVADEPGVVDVDIRSVVKNREYVSWSFSSMGNSSSSVDGTPSGSDGPIVSSWRYRRDKCLTKTTHCSRRRKRENLRRVGNPLPPSRSSQAASVAATGPYPACVSSASLSVDSTNDKVTLVKDGLIDGSGPRVLYNFKVRESFFETNFGRQSSDTDGRSSCSVEAESRVKHCKFVARGIDVPPVDVPASPDVSVPPMENVDDNRADPGVVADAGRPAGRESRTNRYRLSALRKRLPRSSVVVLTCGDGVTYADAMRRAKECVSLATLGIFSVKMRRAITGALVLEVNGNNASEKAALLESRLLEIFEGIDVRISRPVRKVELKLQGMDDSIEPRDIVEAISKLGGCLAKDVKCGGVYSTRVGLGAARIECPIAAAIKILESQSVTIGWSHVRVELVGSKRIRCYRCFTVGHPLQRCPNQTDMNGRCLRCGARGHLSTYCRNPANCLVCAERGLKHDHKTGDDKCPPCPPGRLH